MLFATSVRFSVPRTVPIEKCARVLRAPWVRTVLLATPILIASSSALGSPLSEAANQIGPGESIRLNTELSGSLLAPDGADFLQWGSSGVWDARRGEIRYIGKRHNSYGYRWLVYDADTDTWTNDRELPSSLLSPQPGHGYDHNTIDPASGDHYFRPYNSTTIYKWAGQWTQILMPSGPTTVAASISWVPEYGIVYTDAHRFESYDGKSWMQLNGGETGISSYHSISEYNPISNTLVLGAGNGSSNLAKWDLTAKTLTPIAAPPFNVGSAANQGLFVSAPGSAKYVAWEKGTSNWAEYDVVSNSWRQLTVAASASSYLRQSGAPNLSSSSTGVAAIGIPINTHGVIMFIQFLGQSSNAAVWLYRPSDSISEIGPTRPENLTAR
jgi:hypothetical protein